MALLLLLLLVVVSVAQRGAARRRAVEFQPLEPLIAGSVAGRSEWGAGGAGLRAAEGGDGALLRRRSSALEPLPPGGALLRRRSSAAPGGALLRRRSSVAPAARLASQPRAARRASLDGGGARSPPLVV